MKRSTFHIFWGISERRLFTHVPEEGERHSLQTGESGSHPFSTWHTAVSLSILKFLNGMQELRVIIVNNYQYTAHVYSMKALSFVHDGIFLWNELPGNRNAISQWKQTTNQANLASEPHSISWFPQFPSNWSKEGQGGTGGFKGWVCDLWDGIALRDECQQEENDQNMAQKRLHVEKSQKWPWPRKWEVWMAEPEDLLFPGCLSPLIHVSLWIYLLFNWSRLGWVCLPHLNSHSTPPILQQKILRP